MQKVNFWGMYGVWGGVEYRLTLNSENLNTYIFLCGVMGYYDFILLKPNIRGVGYETAKWVRFGTFS